MKQHDKRVCQEEIIKKWEERLPQAKEKGEQYYLTAHIEELVELH
jgi:hypothetical protein